MYESELYLAPLSLTFLNLEDVATKNSLVNPGFVCLFVWGEGLCLSSESITSSLLVIDNR